MKTQLTVNKDGLIVHKTNHARGRRHDYDIFKRNHPKLPKKVKPGFDLGYRGVQKDLPEMNPIVPFKRSRWHPRLTKRQKRFNGALSKARVVVEHTISRLKKFNIFGQEQAQALRRGDGHSLRACQLQDNGEQPDSLTEQVHPRKGRQEDVQPMLLCNRSIER